MLHMLFICTGNTCRSPMAKAIFAQKSAEYGIQCTFSSAAIGFISTGGVSPSAVTVMNEIGLDISEHIPRSFREHDLDVTDIYIVMTTDHAKAITSLGVKKSKVHILGGGIPDPYGTDLVTYRRCRRLIEDGVDELCRRVIEKFPYCVTDQSRSLPESDG